VEVLTAYSHSTQAADLRLYHTVVLTSPACAPRPSAKRPWSLRERLDEHDIAELITAYRDSATAASLAASLAATHGVSFQSVSASYTPPRYPPNTTHPTIHDDHTDRHGSIARSCPEFTARNTAA
jgi:hypothetical protein